MQVCKAAQFEPLIITTPASVLRGVFFLAPEYFKQDAAIMAWRGFTVYLALRFDGRVRIDRVIEIATLGTNEGERLKALTTELLHASSCRIRYSRPIEHLYLVGQLGRGCRICRLRIPFSSYSDARSRMFLFRFRYR